jgi:hypothetical protein
VFFVNYSLPFQPAQRTNRAYVNKTVHPIRQRCVHKIPCAFGVDPRDSGGKPWIERHNGTRMNYCIDALQRIIHRNGIQKIKLPPLYLFI